MARQTFEPALVYRVFFLYVEPLATVIAAFAAAFQQKLYLELTHFPTAPRGSIPISNSVVLNQLANLYFLFAINEGLVLRSTSDVKVWRAIIIALLIADLGHIWSVHPLGYSIYWDVTNWNTIDWGNLGFVYLGALIRTSFLIQTSSKKILSQEHGNQLETPRRSSRKTKPTQKLKE